MSDREHLLCYPDETAASADLPAWRGENGWIGDIIAGVRVYLAEATWGVPDPETGERERLTPPVVLPGFWLWITTAGQDAGLLAREACRIVVDVAAAAAGAPFVVMVRDPAVAAQVVRIEPMPGDRAYPFGNLVMIV